ncbi:hypothetical protein SK128_000845 [Halocaridina rubra]|uniref:Treslin N-terminal domain-containing protein n=1 Tax=Halocaridina rubra TaxID=373956 RepID=A0AAN9AHK3_HALRR
MFSSVQALFLYDVNCLSDKCRSESELEQNVAKLKLSCLKLLTEFGAQTEKGIEVVRWRDEYYDSLLYKPDTNRKGFVDFNRNSFEEFGNHITDVFCNAFDKAPHSSDDRSAGDAKEKNTRHSHAFILKKALQEILLDYNWDRPDISSPVKPVRRRSCRGKNTKISQEDSSVSYNTVVVLTNIPQNAEEFNEFCGISKRKSFSDDFLGNVLDPAMLKGFQEEKKIHLNIVDLNNLALSSVKESAENKIYSSINAGLAKLGGGLHFINALVETSASLEADRKAIIKNEAQTTFQNVFPKSVNFESLRVKTPWWRKKSRGTRPRRPQRGPLLIWEDLEGISHIQVALEVLAVNGSSSRNWGNAFVVTVMQNNSMSLLALAGGTGQLYVCHAPNTIFTFIIELLKKQQLAMLLKLSCGSVAVLSPWIGGVGSLAVISASGLAIPRLHSHPSPQESKMKHPAIVKFISQTIEKCLKNAPAHSIVEPETYKKRFAAHQLERWFSPLNVTVESVEHVIKKKKSTTVRAAMQECLQKKYRPQIPLPLATGEIDKIDLVDITQPPADPEPVADTKSLMSRAQKLVKKSHIVTAQQKVKSE